MVYLMPMKLELSVGVFVGVLFAGEVLKEMVIRRTDPWLPLQSLSKSHTFFLRLCALFLSVSKLRGQGNTYKSRLFESAIPRFAQDVVSLSALLKGLDMLLGQKE